MTGSESPAVPAESKAFKRAFYFGCVDRPGRHLWSAPSPGHYRPVRVSQKRQAELLGALIPWGPALLDGRLVPKGYAEGQAVLLHEENWTALGFRDRSIDKRRDSESCFLFDAPELSYRVAIRAAIREFPLLWDRFSFDVVPGPDLLAGDGGLG